MGVVGVELTAAAVSCLAGDAAAAYLLHLATESAG